MTNFKTIPSKHGKHDLVVYEGHKYCFDKKIKDTIYYKCTNHKTCPGRGKLVDSVPHFQVLNNDHNHAASVDSQHRSVTLRLLKDATRENPTTTLKTVYNDVATRRKSVLCEFASATTIPPFVEIYTVMRNERKKNQPPIPQTINDIVLTQDMRYLSGQEFVFMQNGIVMFVKEPLLSTLAGASCIYGDGTFYVTPGIFAQVYTLHVLVSNSMVCCAYFLLPGKTHDIYVQMFQMLQAKRAITASRFQTDFEMATISAIGQVFPNADITCCFFHYTQAIWRKVQSIGLSSEYNKGDIVQVVKIVRRLGALPFLKHDDVPEGFLSALDLIQTIQTGVDGGISMDRVRIKRKLSELCDYFASTWVDDNARFEVGLWSRYEVEGPRTNNHLEGFHSALKKAVGSAHPNIYKFIEAIKKEQKNNELKLLQLETGGQVARKNTKYVRMEGKIQLLIQRYKNNELVIPQFLDQVGGLLHFGY